MTAGPRGQCTVSGPSVDAVSAEDATFSSPYGIDADVEGNVYVADSSSNVVRRIRAGALPAWDPAVVAPCVPTQLPPAPAW